MNTSTGKLEAFSSSSSSSSSATANHKTLSKVQLLISPSDTADCGKDGQAWFAATSLQSDLRVEVDSTEFHLHKFPLLSRSGLLNRLVFESRDTEKGDIRLQCFPGGRAAFELAAKFCYGVPVHITAGNVAALRCAAQYLEMEENHKHHQQHDENDNLVAQTEHFLTSRVLPSWNHSISVLRTCSADLLPWSETLHIVQRCIESVAWKACTDPTGIRWPYSRGRSSFHDSCINPRLDLPNPSPSHSHDPDKTSASIPQDWWFEDVCLLSTDHFVRVVNAIKAKGMRAELVGLAITCYAMKWLPCLLDGDASYHEGVAQDECKGFNPRVNKSAVEEQIGRVGEDERKIEEAIAGEGADGGANHTFRGFDVPFHEVEDLSEARSKQRVLVESLIAILPTQIDAVSVRFQLHLLRVANMLGMDSVCLGELENRVALQFDRISLSDLLPSSNHMYDNSSDVTMVHRMLQSFLLHHENGLPDGSPLLKSPSVIALSVKTRIAEVVDGYLSHVANDPTLALQSFQDLTEVLPGNVRSSCDGLYKAIDTFLKVHPALTEVERQQLCQSIDVHKLSIDSCMHVSQNERLPLRMVISVLFSEHMKLRNALTGGGHSSLLPSEDNTPTLHALTQFARVSTSDSDPQSSRDGWSIHNHHHHHSADVRALQIEVQQMKTEFMGLRSYCSGLEEQLDSKAPKKKGFFFSWPGSSFSKKLNSKLKSISSRRQSSSEAPHHSALSGASNTSFNANQSRSDNDRWRRRNSVS